MNYIEDLQTFHDEEQSENLFRKNSTKTKSRQHMLISKTNSIKNTNKNTDVDLLNRKKIIQKDLNEYKSERETSRNIRKLGIGKFLIYYKYFDYCF
jgi:hypothetical protein